MSETEQKANNLILIGFMGTGKTTVGKRVAQSLKLEFVDTDALIIEQEEKSIQAIFEESGETEFRKIETAVLENCCAGSGQVISTGGGIVTQEANLPILERGGHVIWLKASPDVIFERIKRNHERPLLKTEDPEQTIRDLLDGRENFYEQCARMTILTDDLSLEETIYGVIETAMFWKINRNGDSD